MEQLRNATWNGIPENHPGQRCEAWKLLLDYLPIDKEFRTEMLSRKREEYNEIVKNYFGDFSHSSVNDLLQSENDSKSIKLSDFEKKNFKQIKIDVLRTQPDLPVFQSPQM